MLQYPTWLTSLTFSDCEGCDASMCPGFSVCAASLRSGEGCGSFESSLIPLSVFASHVCCTNVYVPAMYAVPPSVSPISLVR